MEERPGVEIKRQCPITKGQPTSMTAGGFADQCAFERDAAKTLVEQDAMISSRKVIFTPICLSCSGAYPQELTIIELPNCSEGEKNMGTNKTTDDTCQWCGKKGKVTNHHGKTSCFSCVAAVTTAKNRPLVAMAMLQSFAPEVLGASASTDERQNIERIAELEDQLVDARCTLDGLRDDNSELVIKLHEQNEVITEIKIRNLGFDLIDRICSGSVSGINASDIKTLLGV